MTPTDRGRRPRRSEAELVRQVVAYLEHEGYRVRADPDGTDYFDVVARRGDEVGLVEVKVGRPRAVLAQAVKRRGWGDWCAVAVDSARAAARLAAATGSSRAARVGIWSVGPDSVTVHRPARPWVAPGEDDPFGELRERLRHWLDLVDAGDLPGSVRWDGVPGAVRRASGGRGFGEWRLDEPAPRDR